MGINTWLVQRISGLIIALYSSFLFIYWLLPNHTQFSAWTKLFHLQSVKFFSFLTIIALLVHSWIGIQTIFQDYVKTIAIRIFIQTLFLFAMLFYLVWGVQILWL